MAQNCPEQQKQSPGQRPKPSHYAPLRSPKEPSSQHQSPGALTDKEATNHATSKSFLRVMQQQLRRLAVHCKSHSCTEGHMWIREIIVMWRWNMVFMWGRDIIVMWKSDGIVMWRGYTMVKSQFIFVFEWQCTSWAATSSV